MDSKRRLPVLKTPQADAPDEEPRPPWQWVGFGAVAIFVAWLPLSLLVGALAARLAAGAEGGTQDDVVRAALTIRVAYFVELALGAIGGGFVVGRWGAAGVGVREAALAGLAAGLIAVGVSCASFGVSVGSLVVIVAIAVPAAAIGGWLGLRRRARG
jgi:hypothetical protein